MTDPYIGEIRIFGGEFAPRDWAFCNGQTLNINDNQALYSVIGTMYGGDGRITFALPDLRGRAPISCGTAPGLVDNYFCGQRGGSETVALTAPQAPAHTHDASIQVKAVAGAGNQSAPGGHVWAADPRGATNVYSDVGPDTTMNEKAAVGTAEPNAGGGQAHENRPPFLVLNFIIALQGTYPSRS
jgi:microcystin-dependent protein